jgi:predicted site-specific integrase-resolvase
VPFVRLPTGTLIVQEPATLPGEGAALYARVSSADQKGDLDRQLARLSEYAAAQGIHVVDAIQEVGSGLNGHRRKMLRILNNPLVKVIVVEHRERLMRFGFEYVESALAAQGRKVIVIEPDELTDDVVRDLHEVIVSMCARLYGKRSAKNRAKKAIDAIHVDPHD